MEEVEPGTFVIQADVQALREYLDSKEGDPNKKYKDWPHNTLLMDAVMEGNGEIVALLLDKINEKGLDPNLRCTDKTPLELAKHKDERRQTPENTIILTLLNQAKELYLIKRMQARRRGKTSRLESKAEGRMTKKEKIKEWPKMKRTLQAQGWTEWDILDFAENSYLLERGDTPERSRRSIHEKHGMKKKKRKKTKKTKKKKTKKTKKVKKTKK